VFEVFQLAHLVADHDAGIPQWVQHRSQERLVGLVDGVPEEHEDVEIGMQAQVPAAVSTDGRNRHWSGAGRSFRNEPPDQFVNAVCVPFEGGPAPRAAGDVGFQFGACRTEGGRHRRAGRSRAGHG
jgi:hypothetical protein